MVELHPEILSRNGKKMFAILPYDEFVMLQEQLEDAADLRDLREARDASKNERPIPLEKILKRYRKKA